MAPVYKYFGRLCLGLGARGRGKLKVWSAVGLVKSSEFSPAKYVIFV
jgi:hypothetical protein